MKSPVVLWLGVAVCFLVAGGVAALAIRYPAVWSAIEWLAIGIAVAVAVSWRWLSRHGKPVDRAEAGPLTPDEKRALRRDLLVAVAVVFASVVGLVAAVKVAGRSALEIPPWLAWLAVAAWVGATVVVAAPLVSRVSQALLSRVGRGADGDANEGSRPER